MNSKLNEAGFLEWGRERNEKFIVRTPRRTMNQFSKKRYYTDEELAFYPLHFAVEQLSVRELAAAWGIGKTQAALYKNGTQPINEEMEAQLERYLFSRLEEVRRRDPDEENGRKRRNHHSLW